ncbi:MAG: hypothetical protein ACW98F_08135 [Candidatus Hodarchaeales archaeon]|jgi:hypothetical protein
MDNNKLFIVNVRGDDPDLSEIISLFDEHYPNKVAYTKNTVMVTSIFHTNVYHLLRLLDNELGFDNPDYSVIDIR